MAAKNYIHKKKYLCLFGGKFMRVLETEGYNLCGNISAATFRFICNTLTDNEFSFWQTKTLQTDFSSRMPDCIRRGNCFATWKMSLFGGSNHHQGRRDVEFGKHALSRHSRKMGKNMCFSIKIISIQ